ncbi:MAG: bifunctional folylpolyglutamate synthase/dihydrofolate synthase [Candidatus Xiphinematobacter sp.]|nr:MAG: bifunctional folylpolyglutamate synthase/dihydrofolate synthase [Candidatus Xiphinematobacter sp.]QQY09157.1 MAG: bifunctional folylpolyglutamate synthase/dihydrofolate synthase [Candidatus Xiphinematobacter sp.]QQY09907.1 MAG: bifunctional folylpolyglutamate synthase/dihydrofolate synthase [Candidatus Xiphinematobacter sp.]QQY11383.1 MAG: bifunctional folylpolyglutamate synthase/dihydrofolate synthase [Candidatus Xiphinematobacter sp.]
MTFDKALRWLYSRRRFGIRLGLETTQFLLALLGNPEKKLRFLHVAGTNGKGSVCAFLDSILRAEGKKTGLFTSPHLMDFRERIRVNGRPISKEAAAEGLTLLRDLANSHTHKLRKLEPTFFELATALATWYFLRKNAEVAIWETGMGGRWDATNVVTPLVSIVTSISFDHQQWLGNSLVEIACEKSGIFKAGVPAVSAPQSIEVAETLRSRAAIYRVPLYFVKAPWSASKIGLRGEHQRWNAAVAVAALEASGITISTDSISNGLANTHWPGRFQILSERLVVDGAHNPGATRTLVATWKEVFGNQQACVVFGSLEDKESKRMLEILSTITREFRFVPVTNHRSSGRYLAPPHKIIGHFENLSAALIAPPQPENTIILITGSLFLVGEILAQKARKRESTDFVSPGPGGGKQNKLPTLLG